MSWRIRIDMKATKGVVAALALGLLIETCAASDAELRNGVNQSNYEFALKLARRLFYKTDRTPSELTAARQHFLSARQFAEPNNLRVCEFCLMHQSADFERAERHCLRAVVVDEYHALMALAHIYEFGPEAIRNQTHAYACYLLVAQIKGGELYEPARAGRKRVGRKLSRAERKAIDVRAGAGWSLF